MNRVVKRLLILIGLLTGISFAFPQPQPILYVSKATVQKLQKRYNLEIIHKEIVYEVRKAEVYKLLSGEKFRYIDPNSASLEVKKHCFYAKDEPNMQPKKLYCFIEYIKDTKTGSILYQYQPSAEKIENELQSKINALINSSVQQTVSATSSSATSVPQIPLLNW